MAGTKHALRTRFTDLVKRHPVTTYFALVFAISWGSGLILLEPDVFVGIKPMPTSRFLPVMFLALAGPSAAGILCTVLVSGRPGLRELRLRLFRWRVGLRWYAVALLTAPLLTAATLFALALASPAFLPSILTTDNRVGLLVLAIAAALIAPFFEELGWTGFATPQLRRRHSVATTGLIVGLLWGAWHFPLFAGTATSSAPISPALYLGVLLFSWLPPYRVLMVWVYDRTKSLLLAMLMHVPIVIDSFVLLPTRGSVTIVTFDLVWAVALWLLALFILRTRSG